MKKTIISIVALTLSYSAFADQCAFLKPAQALSAVQLLQGTSTAYYLCEPCGELTPKKININTVESFKLFPQELRLYCLSTHPKIVHPHHRFPTLENPVPPYNQLHG